MTTINIPEYIEKVRVAIDERMDVTDDSFYEDLDKEIRQALVMAVRQMSQQLPVDKLIPSTASGMTVSHPTTEDGSGYVTLPDDWLRLISFKMSCWLHPVYESLYPASDEAKRQSSKWTRGTPQKPKVMEDYNAEGKRILRFWSVAKGSSAYDYTVEICTYIPTVDNPGDTADTMSVPIKETAMDNIIYRAASLVMTGKKESELASEFMALSNAGTIQAAIPQEAVTQ